MTSMRRMSVETTNGDSKLGLTETWIFEKTGTAVAGTYSNIGTASCRFPIWVARNWLRRMPPPTWLPLTMMPLGSGGLLDLARSIRRRSICYLQ